MRPEVFVKYVLDFRRLSQVCFFTSENFLYERYLFLKLNVDSVVYFLLDML